MGCSFIRCKGAEMRPIEPALGNASGGNVDDTFGSPCFFLCFNHYFFSCFVRLPSPPERFRFPPRLSLNGTSTDASSFCRDLGRHLVWGHFWGDSNCL